MKFLFINFLICISVQVVLAAAPFIPPSPFEKTKLILRSPQKIDRQSRLVALFNTDCIQEFGLTPLNKFRSEIEVEDQTPHLTSHLKVFIMRIKKSVSYQKLNEFANSSACLIGVTDDAEYRTSFNDPLFSQQTQHPFLKTEDFYNKASWLPVSEDQKAVIAVIDTGVDYRHSDLTRMMYRQNGNIVGASFVQNVPDFLDDHGHGTHVAGLAAAEVNNGVGGIGACGVSCSIMPIKVLNAQGSGTLASVANGIFWAVDHGANVLNLSLARSLNFVGMAPVDLEAFRYAMKKNVIVAVAAGNEGAFLDMNGPQSWPTMMAALPGVTSVASLDSATGNLSTFSNRNSKYVEIAAPGSTRSTGGTYVGLLSTARGGGYTRMSGTSMAAPIVAGSMGLIISHYKKFNIPYNVWDIEVFLKSGTFNNSSLNALVEGGRVLDLSILADKLQMVLENPFKLDVRDAIEGFVVDLYYVILRRNYDTGGAQYHLDNMLVHQLPLELMMLGFFNSPEFYVGFGNIQDRENSGYWNVVRDHFIPDVYLTLLGRLPSQADWDYWTDYLGVYKNKHRIMIRTLLKSPEFDARVAGTKLANYPRMEILPGDLQQRCLAKDFKGDSSVGKQVDFGYCMALERTADADR
ncbi:MAG: S8 family serine peptidase, partial [Pseudobdellovibrionaceae bacterium]